MSTIINLISFILILGVIVLVHEFGHFIFAKMFGIYVYEFSIGMGPKIFGKKGKGGETEYCIRAIPIGGFVQLAGEEIDDDDKVPKDRKLYSKKVWQRFLVMFFGAGNNFILAFLSLLLMAFIWGSPDMSPVINKVTEGYPIAEVGIEAGDKILAINKHKVSTMDDVSLYLTLENKGGDITFKIKNSEGEIKDVTVKPKKEEVDGNTVYRVGLEFESQPKKGFLRSIKYAFVKMGAMFKQMVVVLKNLFTGGIGLNNLAGPVGIYSIVGQTREAGFASILQLVALLSLNVGFINLLPFPAFDGGRILFLLIEKIKGSPVKQETENLIHTVGFILLMLLMVYITFNDILRLF